MKIQTKKVTLLFACLYLLWGITLIYSYFKTGNLVLFTYLAIFQFFVPGMVLGASFGLFNRPLTEIILFSFIISYIIFLLATLPTVTFQITWQFFVGANVFLYLVVLAFFLAKSYNGLSFSFKKPGVHEIFILAFGILILLSYTYIRYRGDSGNYNQMISSSVESNYIEPYAHKWRSDKNGNFIREPAKTSANAYHQFYNFLALPLKYSSSLDRRYVWLIYCKLFLFLSIISVYCLGTRLSNPTCGFLSVLFYIFTVFLLGFYYHYLRGEVGLMFINSGHPRYVGEHIFLFAFYMTMIESFIRKNMRTFLFAGIILLCIYSTHFYGFIVAVINYAVFSLIIFIILSFRIKEFKSVFYKIAISGLVVASVTGVYLIIMFVFTDYYKELLSTVELFKEVAIDHSGNRSLNFYEKLGTFLGRTKILIVSSITLGIPFFVIFRDKLKQNYGAMFLLSNLTMYLILKFPLYEAFRKVNFAAAWLVDGMVFPYFILSFMIVYILKRVKPNLNMVHIRSAAGFLMVLIYIAYGTNNVFAKKFRSRHLEGNNHLIMTEYINYIKKSSDDTITVMSDFKSYEPYAYLNAYFFQSDGIARYPKACDIEKNKEIEKYLFYPRKYEDNVMAFLKNNRVDYILIPTPVTQWSTKRKKAENFDQAVDFYNRVRTYRLIYSDKYYYLYQRTASYPE